MKLVELDPRFMRYEAPDCWREVDTLAEATGIMFACPKCFEGNGGLRGTHSILCWSPAVPLSEPPAPGRWKLEGTGFGDLSLVASSSSVLLTSGCRAHFWVRGGEIVRDW